MQEQVSVHLVEAGDHIMGSFDQKLVKYTTRLLQHRKVSARAFLFYVYNFMLILLNPRWSGHEYDRVLQTTMQKMYWSTDTIVAGWGPVL